MREQCKEPQAHPSRCDCGEAAEADWRNALRTANAHTRQLMAERDALHAEVEANAKSATYYMDAFADAKAEAEALRAQVSALQSDANSWQSGYDKGREDGAKAAEGWKAQHARDSAELRKLCAERDTLTAELTRWWRSYREVHEPALREAHAYIQELRAELEAIKGQQPVAWQRWAGEYHEVTYERLTDDHFDRGWSERPLYTTPQPGPDVRGLVSVSTNILGKLQHPTACVNSMDMWKLEDALKPFVDNRQAQQGGSHDT